MKRFLCGSVGLLCLAIAFHLGASTANTCYVDHTCRGAVAHTHGRNSGVKILDEDGVVWSVSENQGWQADTDVPPFPCAPVEIKFFEVSGQGCSVVTFCNQVWIWDGHGGWEDCGVWPGDTAVEASSWGRIKAGYMDDK